MSIARSCLSQRGFTLAEVLLAAMLGGLLAALVLALLLAMARSFLPERVSAAGETLAVAPCFEVVPPAMAFHSTLRDCLTKARAVYTFGGSYEGGAEEGMALRPLLAKELPSLASLPLGLPKDAGGFWTAYAESLGALEANADVEDFSVLLLGQGSNGRPEVTALAQCRTQLWRDASGAEWKRRRANLWVAGGEQHAYAFLEPTDRASWVGALHTWQRHDPVLGLHEEGPCLVSFPDPWVLAGSRGGQALPALPSRFTYLIPVHP